MSSQTEKEDLAQQIRHINSDFQFLNPKLNSLPFPLLENCYVVLDPPLP